MKKIIRFWTSNAKKMITYKHYLLLFCCTICSHLATAQTIAEVVLLSQKVDTIIKTDSFTIHRSQLFNLMLNTPQSCAAKIYVTDMECSLRFFVAHQDKKTTFGHLNMKNSINVPFIIDKKKGKLYFIQFFPELYFATEDTIIVTPKPPKIVDINVLNNVKITIFDKNTNIIKTIEYRNGDRKGRLHTFIINYKKDSTGCIKVISNIHWTMHTGYNNYLKKQFLKFLTHFPEEKKRYGSILEDRFSTENSFYYLKNGQVYGYKDLRTKEERDSKCKDKFN